MLLPLVRGIRVCYLSCMVTVAVLILWWLFCFTVNFTSTEDGIKYSPKRRVALHAVTLQQTITYSLNDIT
jgi:ammonia channel protein AmtB